jgi:molecular chaperone DnaJ
MAQQSLYEILGVDKTASADDIKSAYRRLAKKYHPDVYATADEKTKKDAEAKFKDITHAYEVLSDPQKKAAYDQYGSEDGPQFSGGNPFGEGSPFGAGGFEDIFSSFFNGFTSRGGRQQSRRQQVGDNIEHVVNLTFKEACFGVNGKEISFLRMEKCPHCKGLGANSPSGIKVCPRCKGSGVATTQTRTPFGVMQTQGECPDCNGTGKIITDRCIECYGKGRIRKQCTKKINIPAGVNTGNSMTINGEGHAAPGEGGTNGMLLLIFKVAPHPLFVREKNDISYEYPITFLQAALGAKVTVPTLDGTTVLDIPEGTQNGKVLRIKGKGVKDLRKNEYGDIYVHIIVDVPKSLNLKQRAILNEATSVLSGAKYEQIEKFNKKLRDL